MEAQTFRQRQLLWRPTDPSTAALRSGLRGIPEEWNVLAGVVGTGKREGQGEADTKERTCQGERKLRVNWG